MVSFWFQFGLDSSGSVKLGGGTSLRISALRNCQCEEPVPVLESLPRDGLDSRIDNFSIKESLLKA